MSNIPQAFVEDVLQRSSIVEIIGKRVQLKKKGKEYSGLCPFHGEKTPSFSVNEEKQLYYCHGCGAKGNIISFMTKYERHQFPEAVELLASKLGLSMPEQTPEAREHHSQTETIYQCLKSASSWYQAQLRKHPNKASAINYLQGRGMEGQYAKSFHVGYAPANSTNLLDALGQQNKEQIKQLEQAGLIRCKEKEENAFYDVFINRIMFPIRDVRGRIIAFGGRALSEQAKAKYINSPETPVYTKGRHLYGLYEVLQQRTQYSYLLIVEGYMDVLIAHQFGFNNTVATLGTAINKEQLELGFRQHNKLIFCFDGDAAGRKAAERVLEPSMQAMRDGREICFLFMPEGHDPDSLLQTEGADAVNALISEAQPLSQALLEYLKRGLNLDHIEGSAQLKDKACRYLQLLAPCAFKTLLIQKIAQLMRIESTELEQLLIQVNDHRDSTEQNKYAKSTQTQQRVDSPRSLNFINSPELATLSPLGQLLALLMYNPSLMHQCDHGLVECLRQWPLVDQMTEPLIELLIQLKDCPDTNINDIHERYQKNYPKHVSIDHLFAAINPVLLTLTEEQRESKCLEWLNDIIASITKLPKDKARHDKANADYRKIHNLSPQHLH